MSIATMCSVAIGRPMAFVEFAAPGFLPLVGVNEIFKKIFLVCFFHGWRQINTHLNMDKMSRLKLKRLIQTK